jgi:DNA ligase-associated metallophosphoesterase
MYSLPLLGNTLHLLPEKAIDLPEHRALLVSDVHLGKSETFQSLGIPIPNGVNQTTLDRLQNLCLHHQPDHLFILGDLFHSRYALVDEVIDAWMKFVQSIHADVKLIIGNHDRALVSTLQQLSIQCITDAIQVNNLILSHEPYFGSGCFNICGHIHPCVRISSKSDTLRLPCFYVDHSRQQLILPSFGEFTGGADLPLKSGTTAYVVVENAVIPFAG